MSLKEKIKAGAENLGFVAVGFTSVFPAPGFERYRDWVANDQQAGMDYLANQHALERRADPRRLLLSCRTVVSLLSCYPPPGDLKSDRVISEETSAIGMDRDLRSERVLGPYRRLRTEETGTIKDVGTGTIGDKGRIAAYALQEDYHEVLKQRLDQLADLIHELAENEVETFACVDSAPILEKGYAQRSGLGWIGRNSLLLHPDFGSWTHLSELLISLELEPDLPFETDGCGECQLCVRACPTQAILPNRSINARRCLSYLTIENRGEIPPEFRKALGNRIFGCDQCQSICPVNKKARLTSKTTVIEEFPDLEESFRITAEEFKQKYRHTPVWRVKFRGFRRNLAIAMGNSRQKEFVPILEQSLDDETDKIVADSIRWALEELRSA